MMDVFKVLLYLILISCTFLSVTADNHCLDTDVKGDWTFSIGPGGNNRTLKCDSFHVKSTYKVKLELPNVAVDQDGVKGTWTMMDDAAFEVTIAGKIYFAFFKEHRSTTLCGHLKNGWSHNSKDEDWACYYGEKSSDLIFKEETSRKNEMRLETESNPNLDDIVEAINNAGLSWTARKYPQFEGLTRADFVKMTGGKVRRGGPPPKTAPLTEEDIADMKKLPKSFDWRNVKGVNYVSPVRDQGDCGSCYAFAGMAMLEARVRIATKNKKKPVFSPQDVIDCSEYSMKCDGGWAYLSGGKYAQDFGVVTEECNPYTESEHDECTTSPKCARQYATNYTWIGGYFGACNEARMMKALYKNGPISVAIWAYDDFSTYQDGIYHHPSGIKGLPSRPYEPCNHNVVVIGWGENEKGQKYWIGKNSWDVDWGMKGYFYIRRGNDECAIESAASESFPVFPTADLN